MLLLRATTPAHSAAEWWMASPAQCMRCRIKRMSNLNLDLSISPRVNNINHKVAWLNIKRSSRSNYNYKNNKKVMMTRLYMKVQIFRLILNNWWVPRKRTKRKIDDWTFLMIMEWPELIYLLICNNFNNNKTKWMRVKKLFLSKMKTTCQLIFFILTLFKIQIIRKTKTKKIMKIWWIKQNLKMVNLQTELNLVCLKLQAPSWLKTIDFKFCKMELEQIPLKKFTECPKHLTNSDK